jgi:hypothetical protein
MEKKLVTRYCAYLLVLLLCGSLVAAERHQVGASGSSRGTSGGASLESTAGQNVIGFSGDLSMGFLATTDGHYYVPGDVDGNHMVNISDAVFVISYIFGGGDAPDPYVAADADCNKVVNVSDAVYLIGYIFGGLPAPVHCN